MILCDIPDLQICSVSLSSGVRAPMYAVQAYGGKKKKILFNTQCHKVFPSYSLGRSNIQLLNVETANKVNNKF